MLEGCLKKDLKSVGVWFNLLSAIKMDYQNQNQNKVLEMRRIYENNR